MGHYTTYALKADLRPTTPQYVIETLQWLLDPTKRGPDDQYICPVKAQTDMDRFYMEGEDPGAARSRGSAWDFWYERAKGDPEPFSSITQDDTGRWSIVARSCTKNEEAIDRFLKWVSPYLNHHPEEVIGFWLPDCGHVWRGITPNKGLDSLCLLVGGSSLDPFFTAGHKDVLGHIAVSEVIVRRNKLLKEEGQYDW